MSYVKEQIKLVRNSQKPALLSCCWPTSHWAPGSHGIHKSQGHSTQLFLNGVFSPSIFRNSENLCGRECWNERECCLGGFYCRNKTYWPKATWGGKGLFQFRVILYHWGKSWWKLKVERGTEAETMCVGRGGVMLTSLLPMVCWACFLHNPGPHGPPSWVTY